MPRYVEAQGEITGLVGMRIGRRNRERWDGGGKRRRQGGLALALLALGGCSSIPASMKPTTWWDALTDQKLATERPPPPNADAPYPNLASVPEKPPPPDSKAHQAILAGLVADRSNALYEAAQTPLADPSSPQASPGLFGGSAPPPGAAPGASPPAASAALQAANAPPHPAASTPSAAPVHPSAAPRGGVNQAPLAAPAGQQVAEATPSPTMPETPPPPPNVPGTAVPAVTKPVPPPQAPPPGPPKKPALTAAQAKPLAIGFPPGSPVLPPESLDAIKALAASRGDHAIAVIGYGDAANATPQTQTEAVTLALARARAVIAALTAAGVPADVIAMDAEANGHGALARLVE